MGKFTVIPQDTFDALQMDAGVLLYNFDPANPVAPLDSDIICATTGGVNPSCKPTMSDMGEDVDNCPAGMKELMHLDKWDVTLSTTSLGTSPKLIKMALGCADIDAETSKITPRRNLKQSDFSDIWWVGDKANGGLVAIQIKNALSTDGFSLQTSKNGKGQIALTITGHVSLDAQDEVPMIIYSIDPSESDYWDVRQILNHVTSDYTASAIEAGDALSITLTADEGYTIANVIVTMGGDDVTSTAYEAGEITIAAVTGDVNVIATATSNT